MNPKRHSNSAKPSPIAEGKGGRSRPSGPRPAQRAGGGTQELRIIGGVFRSRRIRFQAAEGLRPTGDRVRETLFNWLGQTLYGKSCLDLFAGSGALGLEALSRGASRVDAVDAQMNVVRQLKQAAETLDVSQLPDAQYRVHHGDALTYLVRCGVKYDVVFLDPPFASDPWATLFQRLPAVLNPGASVYVEAPEPPPALQPAPPGWLMIRSAKAGAVWFALFRCEYSQDAPPLNKVTDEDPNQ